jgi:alpha-aminoadipic semialdehyde synthase
MITTSDGTFAPNFKYLESIMKRTPKKSTAANTKSMVIMLEGHLFDSGLINQILDVLETNDCGFEFKECHVRHMGKDEAPLKSDAILKITGSPEADFSKVCSKIAALVTAIEKADATFRRIDSRKSGGLAYVKNQDDKTVLLLGSGRVSKSVVDLLGRTKERNVIVVGNEEGQARDIASFAKRGSHVALDISNDYKRLSDLVKRADVVISLLPVPMHPQIAKMCIDYQTDMVTASYESKEMRKLDQRYA